MNSKIMSVSALFGSVSKTESSRDLWRFVVRTGTCCMVGEEHRGISISIRVARV